MCTALKGVGGNLPQGTLEQLSSLERTLFKVSQQAVTVEEEHGKLLALANITRAANSNL
jgi:hypothetical protein